ncbi:ABC transporter substrate-binding protein [Pseudooceanicola sediminis]|uniref:ABC transporter substrate-binding protein n=2 Tax=Pseudooceanicola sediminis TaxID=2211117 RepID=A0A399IX49_9RHOB|nr:ABC transporter substrate-binding protein [Puniceibacterium sp. HSS470]RII37723.1 ABC transporter substrate-binding protein [Pseudooceanicola sediminis]|tara:strand:+ start:23551 stop:25491 length:1941 start_codon:yes stop_codon:yes gene_type:complete
MQLPFQAPLSRRRLLALGALTAATFAFVAPDARAQEAPSEPSETTESATGDEKIIKSHGYSYFGELKYPADFDHLDFVNVDAPKGGDIAIQASGTFDSLNPFTVKGRAGALASTMYESLLGEAADDYNGSYCLLCESLEYDEGKTWVIFHMRKDAKFSDGTPLTAHDVVFSHNLFIEQGLPSYSAGVKKRVLGAEALDDYTVKFTFATDISRRSLIDQVGATTVFSKKWFEETGARLDEPRFETSPGSGPYMLDSYDVNRRITYKRNPDYWGKDLPLNKGRYNFDTIRVEYFADESAAFEAFKAGEYTFRIETSSRQWATQYDFPAIQAGHVVKAELPDGIPPNNVGFVFNLGREKFKDKRVREAIALAYNFEWTNESLQYGLFKHRESYFQDTPLQANGVPTGEDLAFLEGLGDLVPDALKSEPPVGIHVSSPERLNDRGNLRKAMKLLDDAGWAVGDDGIRRNAQGEVLSIDFPINSASASSLEPVLDNYALNLKAIGIRPDFEKVDPSQYTNRSRNREYDMVYDGYRAGLGTGTGLMQMYGSSEAAFSVFNPAGLASDLVDQIILASLETQSQEEQDASLRALDRALRYEMLMVPTWYKAGYWVAYYDMFEHPDIPPYDLGYLDFWWYNADKAAKLKAAGAMR